ncbi:hypothetical protein [Undibacterium sp. TC9W]|uniref:hypothetical protein n=1 Tax=Undibacterium sp. TC9W TaxID=3413053 RepID=UPI003BF5A300
MSVHYKTINKLKETQELIDLYRDDLDSNALTGIIADYSDKFVLLSLFTEEGVANGFSLVYGEDITRIRWGGNFLESLYALIKRNQAAPCMPGIAINSLHEALASIQEQFGHVTLHTERVRSDVCFIGQVEESDQDFLVLHEYGTRENRDRKHILLALDLITRIDAEAVYEKNLKYLYSRSR